MASTLILETSILPPNAQHIHLLPFLILFLLLLHLPFVGVLCVSSVLSLVTRRRNTRPASDLAALVIPNGAVFLALGTGPVLCLPPLFAQLHHGASLPIPTLLFGIASASLFGQGLLYLHYRAGRFLPGLSGCALLGLAYLVFFAFMAVAAAPELWPLTPSRWPHAFILEVAAQYGLFAAASLSLTGALILAVYFGFEERRLSEDVPHRETLGHVGAGSLLAGALTMPPLILWVLSLARAPALSVPIFALAATSMILLVPAAIIAASALQASEPRRVRTALTLVLGVFVLTTLVPYRSQLVATHDRFALLAENAEQRFALIRQEQETRYAKVESDPLLGEKVFKERCSACHAWDTRVVGPPYGTVLSKYDGRPKALAAFVRNPAKVDPAYPPMPAQGLTESELISVVRYLLDESVRRDSASIKTEGAPAR